MEQKEQEKFALRESKHCRYDKRLILKIVQEVENGLPRKEANRIYGLGKSSLDSWMRDYGSPEYREKIKRRSYTNLQKRTVVTAIEQGRLTIKEAKTAYNIKSEKIIRGWILQFKSEKVEICIENTSPMAKEKSPSKDLDKEVLERALQEAELKIKALNTLIDVAEEQLKIDIRKKSGAKQS
ncbi:transposase [Microcystis wesenbergii]|uniref:transposase n=1 Tax=Microcystis wesenbergii TaxID=44823 RepID=UPI0016800CEC|nr:transposase [Microcystis wesenbergii]MBD2119271.1 transposase [Microcystis wesenbergii FACHB-1339]